MGKIAIQTSMTDPSGAYFYPPGAPILDTDRDFAHAVSKCSGASELEIKASVRGYLANFRAARADHLANHVESRMESARSQATGDAAKTRPVVTGRAPRAKLGPAEAVKHAFMRCSLVERQAYVWRSGLPPGVTHDEAGTQTTPCDVCGQEAAPVGIHVPPGVTTCPKCGHALPAKPAAPARARPVLEASAAALAAARSAKVPEGDERARFRAALQASSAALSALDWQPIDVKRAAYNRACAVLNERFRLTGEFRVRGIGELPTATIVRSGPTMRTRLE